MTARSMPSLRSGLLPRALLVLAACIGVPMTTAGVAHAHHRPNHLDGPTTAPTTSPPTTTATTAPPKTTATTTSPTTTAPATTTTLAAATTPTTTAGGTNPTPGTTTPGTTVTTTGGTTATTTGGTTTATTGTAPSSITGVTGAASSGAATDLAASRSPGTATATGGETRVLSARSGFRANVVRPAVDRRELANRLAPSSGATPSASPTASSEGTALGDEAADIQPAPSVLPPEQAEVDRPLALDAAEERIDGSAPAASTGGSGLGATTLLAVGAVLALAAGFLVLDNRGWGWWPWVADAGPDEAGS